MALSDYMPYGAPELLDGARSRMARSTLVASLVVVMLVSGLGAMLDHGGTSIAIEPPGADADTLMAPPRDSPPDHGTMPPAPQPVAPTDPQALALLVPDTLATADASHVAPALPDAPDGDGPKAGIASAIGRTGSEAGRSRDPEPGEFVVTDELPSPVRCAEARYPDLAREAGIEGTVRVLMLVGLDGRVERAIVAPGGSVLMLDEAALAASRQCVFTPALTGNHPVKVWVSRSYHFTLH